MYRWLILLFIATTAFFVYSTFFNTDKPVLEGLEVQGESSEPAYTIRQVATQDGVQYEVLKETAVVFVVEGTWSLHEMDLNIVRDGMNEPISYDNFDKTYNYSIQHADSKTDVKITFHQADPYATVLTNDIQYEIYKSGSILDKDSGEEVGYFKKNVLVGDVYLFAIPYILHQLTLKDMKTLYDTELLGN